MTTGSLACLTTLRRHFLFLPLLAVLSAGLKAELNTMTQLPDGTARKEIKAVRLSAERITMDGRLDEAIWKNATFVSDFTQRDPNQGAAPESKSEVAVVYDDEALYIGGRMYSVEPKKLHMQLDRRDNQGSLSEQFIVSIDSYCDRRTCYGFGVNSAGVRIDRYIGSDNEYNRDYRYDPVWDAHTSRTDFGWTVEMKIPFSQLRFLDKPEQVWGIQFNRYVPSRNEDDFWILVPRNVTGWSSRFGNLTGISGVRPAQRIEVTPYFASDGQFSSLPYRHDLPSVFFDGSRVRGRTGADVKIGLGPNMTLDATFNPDFGQVEADPAEVNLSAYETFFPERRPFFTEGIGLISDFPGQFYTRRIGGRPRGHVAVDPPGFDPVHESYDAEVHTPDASTILGAGKLTGSIWNGGTIAALVALTAREMATTYAEIYSTDSSGTRTGLSRTSTFKSEVDPLSFYGAAVLRKGYGKIGSTATLGVFGMHRFMDRDSPLRNQLRSSAFNVIGSTEYMFAGGNYSINTRTAMAYVTGSKAVITRTQLDSRHYFGRPDQDYLHVNPNRTHLTGWQHFAELNTRSAKHWYPYANIMFASPDLERNDMGQIGRTDIIGGELNQSYNQNDPGKLFRDYSVNGGYSVNYNYGGVRTSSEVYLNFNGRFLNYISCHAHVGRQLPSFDVQSTRGGVAVKNLPGFSSNWGLDSPSNQNVRYGVSSNFGVDELNGYLFILSPYLNARVGNNVFLSFEPQFIRQRQPFQFAGTVSDPTATYAQLDGKRYFFSQFREEELRLSIRASYFFTPRLSLELYAEPFVTNATFSDFEELTAAGTNHTREFDQVTEGENSYTATRGSDVVSIPKVGYNTGYDFRSFRSNVVLRWEFSPGSTMFLVWQRNLSKDNPTTRRDRITGSSFFNTFADNGDDIVAMKIAYWIPLG